MREYKIPKFNEADRTFETRLLFIQDIFLNTYSRDTILTSCIEHKLERTLEQYQIDLKQSSTVLKFAGEPTKILKQMNKELK